jgi:PhzF family phenazine biosynthesis protein
MAYTPFKQVDVFTAVRFRGNPVAVVLDGSGLTARQMQQIAHWTNLSETTFVLPATEAGADYQVRIFTPGGELPFAGHPTIGTAHALLDAGAITARDGALVQQCKAGLIKLKVEAGADGERWIYFDLPEPSFHAFDSKQKAELEGILGLELSDAPQLVDVGARWVVAKLKDAQAVLKVQPDLQRMRDQDVRGGYTGVIIYGSHPAGHPAQLELRAFAPAHGIGEDPVCGSGAGSMAALIRHTGQHKEIGSDLLASQGRLVGRAGVIRLQIEEGHIRVGGNAVTCIDGTLEF